MIEQAHLPKAARKPFRRYKREQAWLSRQILYPVTAFYTLYSIIMMFVAFRTKHPFIAIAFYLAGIPVWLAGLAAFIVWWSVANIMTSLSRSAFSLGAFRFLLGIGEPGNYTAAPKAVSEWFPPKERALVVGIYTAGATLGATIAPPVIAVLATRWSWRAVFVLTGSLGLTPGR